jgi:hypothetical protein
VTTLTLEYQRIHQKVDGEYPFQGAFIIEQAREAFDSLFFKRIVGRLHELLVMYPHLTRVIFQRTDRQGIVPIELGPGTVETLRVDPLTAYRSMNFNPEPSVNITGSSIGAEFARHLHIRVQDGKVEDPLSGSWRTLAYGSKQGWKIRGENNRSTTWLPLVALIDDAPEGTSNIERIAFTRWALVDVEALLATDVTHFYLPRPWNLNGPWISREELQHLYKKSKETVS